MAGDRNLAETAEGMDLPLHGVDVGDGGEIEVLAPDEGGEIGEKCPAGMSPAMARALMKAARSQFWPTFS